MFRCPVSPLGLFALNREHENRLLWMVARRYGARLLLPLPVRQVLSVIKAAKFVLRGLRSMTNLLPEGQAES